MEGIQVVIKGVGTFSLKKGENVLSILGKERQELVSGCGGNGNCGKCALRFMMGAPLPTASDRKFFSPSALREGYRLACLARPQQNCIVDFCFDDKQLEIIDFIKEDGQEDAGSEETAEGIPENLGGQLNSRVIVDKSPRDFGDTMVIADLGTTTIVMQLLEIATGKVIDTYKTLNPQRRFGADVMSRITRALAGDDVLLAECVKYCLEGAISKWLYQGFSPELVVVAGNTCMTYFYNEIDVTELSKAPYKATDLDMIETDIAHIRTVFLPGLSAFVGGDITAGLMMTRKFEARLKEEGDGNVNKKALRTVLFIDLGTNGEIALIRGDKTWVTSTSAGPAFEGGAGANTPGSDMVKIIATLLSKGYIDPTGAFTQDEYYQTGVTVEGVVIRQEDVRAIQMAKAAVYAGIMILLSEAGIREDEIDKVYIAGGFGYYLDVKSACDIGLLPKRFFDITTAVGNTSLAGCIEFGLRYRKNPFQDPAAKIREQVTDINLAQVYEFEKTYIGAMDLKEA